MTPNERLDRLESRLEETMRVVQDLRSDLTLLRDAMAQGMPSIRKLPWQAAPVGPSRTVVTAAVTQ